MPEREPHRQPKIPEWARQERQADMGWLRENLPVFWPVASETFKETGRGAIVVDTTQEIIPGAGHPYSYIAQLFIEEYDDEDTKRLVRDYDPKKELVVMLLKADERTSTYRIGRQRKQKR